MYVRPPSLESMAPQINCIHLRASLDSVLLEAISSSRRSSPTSFLYNRVFAIWPFPRSISSSVVHWFNVSSATSPAISKALLSTAVYCIISSRLRNALSRSVLASIDRASMTITFHSVHTGAEWDARYAIEENIRLILNDQLSQRSRRGRTTLV